MAALFTAAVIVVFIVVMFGKLPTFFYLSQMQLQISLNVFEITVLTDLHPILLLVVQNEYKH